MADFLYVCEFSNGHIKVGRAVDPASRVAQHAERVACLGITLDRHAQFACGESAAEAESLLIHRCKAHADQQHKQEWFTGLQFFDVRDWAEGLARASGATPDDEQAPDFRAIVRRLCADGMTQTAIAQHCGCDQSTISDIANGRGEPRYSMGVALLKLAQAAISAAARFGADQELAHGDMDSIRSPNFSHANACESA